MTIAQKDSGGRTSGGAVVAPVAELVYRPVVAAGRLLFRLQGLRFRVEGAENVPATGGAVMAINHIGYLDFTFAGYAALPAGRLVRLAAGGVLASHIRTTDARHASHPGGPRSARRRRTGGAAGVAGRRDRRRLPEATLSRSFELKEFKPGADRMATAPAYHSCQPSSGDRTGLDQGPAAPAGRRRVPISVYVEGAGGGAARHRG